MAGPAEASLAAFLATKGAAAVASHRGAGPWVRQTPSIGGAGAAAASVDVDDGDGGDSLAFWCVSPTAYANFSAGMLRPCARGSTRQLRRAARAFADKLRGHGVPGSWWVGPSAPSLGGGDDGATGAVLEALGFAHAGDESGWQLPLDGAAAAAHVERAAAGLPGVTVAPVTGVDDVLALGGVLEAANDHPTGRGRILADVYSAWHRATEGAPTADKLFHWIAWSDVGDSAPDGSGVAARSEPLACCTVRFSSVDGHNSGDDIVGVYDVAVVPSARRRGLGSLMTAVAVANGRALAPRAQVAALQATKGGEEMYAKLGWGRTGEAFQCYVLAAPVGVSPSLDDTSFHEAPSTGGAEPPPGVVARPPHPSTVVVVAVDVVRDFMAADGAFAQHFGEGETAPVRAVAAEVEQALRNATGAGAATVLVSSAYTDGQFAVPGLCTSTAGRELSLSGDIIEDATMVIEKTSNSLLDVSGVRGNRGARAALLDLISHRTVLLTGVTTPACIATAVRVLRGKCRQVVVPRDAVAGRAHSAPRCSELLDSWAAAGPEVAVVDSWRQVVAPRGTSPSKVPQGPPVLYVVNGSIPSFRVLIALYELDAAFATRRMRVMQRPRPTRLPDFLSLNPRGMTPVLVHAGASQQDGTPPIAARESLQLLYYIDKWFRGAAANARGCRSSAPPLVPEAPANAARAAALAQESEVTRLLLDGIEELFDSGNLAATSVSAATAAVESQAKVLKELAVWEDYAAAASIAAGADAPFYIAGTDALSVADCAMFPVLAWLVRHGFPLLTGPGSRKFPNLARYFNHMKSLPSVRRSVPVGWDTVDESEDAGFNLVGKCVGLARRLRDVDPAPEGLSPGSVDAVIEAASSTTADVEPAPKLPEVTLKTLVAYTGTSHVSATSAAPHASAGAGGGAATGAKTVSAADERSTCTMCGEAFVSRSALFRHIRAAGRHGTGRAPRRKESVFDPTFFAAHGFCAARPLGGLAAGDTHLGFDVLPAELAETALETLKAEIRWSEMRHKGGPVPRLVALQGDLQGTGADVVEPLYRHPADEQPELTAWTPTVERLRRVVEEAIGQPLNHALIQFYHDGKDHISEHADKSLDIARGSNIVNLSLGATRVMKLRRKRDATPEERAQKQSVSLLHASVFVLGWESNRMWTHEIRADKRRLAEKRADELRDGGSRISLTFRYVATYRRRSDGAVFGQGSPFRTLAEAAAAPPLSEEQATAETEAMLAAFGSENRSSTFDWDEGYGRGFRVVNMRLLNEPTGEGGVAGSG